MPGANVARSAGCYMAIQMEAGHQCPITMTNAAVPTLLLQPEIAAEWLPKILSRDYDKSFKPAAAKRGVTIGMGMTEKQGGTDVRANTTTADAGGRRRAGRANTSSPGTSGSCRRRCATPSWCWRRRRAGSRAS